MKYISALFALIAAFTIGVFPTYAAVIYTQLPAGQNVSNPVTITATWDDINDFPAFEDFEPNYIGFELQGDINGEGLDTEDYVSYPTVCVPFASGSISWTHTFPTGAHFYSVYLTGIDDDCENGVTGGQLIAGTEGINDQPVVFQIVTSPPDIDFNFMGTTSPMLLVANVTKGVQQTGKATLPLVGLAGVPLAFVVGKLTMSFLKSLN